MRVLISFIGGASFGVVVGLLTDSGVASFFASAFVTYVILDLIPA